MLKYPKSIYKLYLVTDRYLSKGRNLLEIIDKAISGGVTLVQLREKTATTREFFYEGLKIQNFLNLVLPTSLIGYYLPTSVCVVTCCPRFSCASG